MKTIIDTTSYPVLEQNGFQSISLDLNNVSTFQSWLIRAYKDVFNASAWREWVKCRAGCGYKSTFEEGPLTCPDCSGDIEDYYSDAEIVESVLSVMSKTYFQCLILLKNDAVAGFTWGWQDSLENINATKLGLSENEWKFQKLSENLINNDIGDKDKWYYQSETGIVPAYRTRWVGAALVWINENLLQSNKDKVSAIIQRTSRNSPMFSIRKNLWYTEVFSYNDVDERVLFAKNNF